MKTASMLAALAALSLASPAGAQEYYYYYPPGYPAYPQGYPYGAQGYPAYPPGYPDNTQEYPGGSQDTPDDSQNNPDSTQASPDDTQNSQDSIAELLAAHNQYRASLGLPPLHWSSRLAEKAQSWAEHLAAIGQLVHSGSGQNLAMASPGSESLTQLVQLWGSEQANFTDGVFPDISTTGNWMDVGHYSQMVWRATTEVGCGLAEGNGSDFLVCDYDPPGNVMGERAY
ncbi:MAG: hypothetical protein KGH75_03280 [Rhodospirillales bacterium]|nr:hypothetical protein [Rhodospirillales bacterium]